MCFESLHRLGEVGHSFDDFTEHAVKRFDDESRKAEVLSALSGLRVEDQGAISL